ncbi:NADP-dependent oxidoreductase [Chryseobacterium ginsengisoli]|uniref:NADP-dependent oxidoreductase n=1 Tax=Chryseobacterium ginsengisoli TaxID=363853 RepID=A0ABP9M0G9_9FLAO
MKAIQYKDYGSSDVIEVVEIDIPTIRNDNDVLIKIKAIGVNPVDVKIRTGLMKNIRPVTMPFIPGGEASGIISEIGANVSKYKVGDEVIALTKTNGYAEYITLSEDSLVLKPNTLTFQEAASIGVNIGTAQSVLFTKGKLQKGDKILIQGAAGAVGGTMVQMAKEAGAFVYATASGTGLELAKSLGADEVFDYKLQDIGDILKNIDLVVDTAGGESQSNLFKVLKQNGKLLSIVTPPSKELAEKFKVEAHFVASDISPQTIQNGIDLIRKGKLKPIVSKTFVLEEAAKAQDFLMGGGVNGKIVLMVN